MPGTRASRVVSSDDDTSDSRDSTSTPVYCIQVLLTVPGVTDDDIADARSASANFARYPARGDPTCSAHRRTMTWRWVGVCSRCRAP